MILDVHEMLIKFKFSVSLTEYSVAAFQEVMIRQGAFLGQITGSATLVLVHDSWNVAQVCVIDLMLAMRHC